MLKTSQLFLAIALLTTLNTARTEPALDCKDWFNPGTTANNKYMQKGCYIKGTKKKHGTWFGKDMVHEGDKEKYTYANGVPDGEYEYWNAYGGLKGKCKKGLRDGEFILKDRNGKISKEVYKDGVTEMGKKFGMKPQTCGQVR